MTTQPSPARKVCECLFCQENAVARLTAPKLKPRFFICEGHLVETLGWADPYKRVLGAVIVERLS